MTEQDMRELAAALDVFERCARILRDDPAPWDQRLVPVMLAHKKASECIARILDKAGAP